MHEVKQGSRVANPLLGVSLPPEVAWEHVAPPAGLIPIDFQRINAVFARTVPLKTRVTYADPKGFSLQSAVDDLTSRIPFSMHGGLAQKLDKRAQLFWENLHTWATPPECLRQEIRSQSRLNQALHVILNALFIFLNKKKPDPTDPLKFVRHAKTHFLVLHSNGKFEWLKDTKATDDKLAYQFLVSLLNFLVDLGFAEFHNVLTTTKTDDVRREARDHSASKKISETIIATSELREFTEVLLLNPWMQMFAVKDLTLCASINRVALKALLRGWFDKTSQYETYFKENITAIHAALTYMRKSQIREVLNFINSQRKSTGVTSEGSDLNSENSDSPNSPKIVLPTEEEAKVFVRNSKTTLIEVLHLEKFDEGYTVSGPEALEKLLVSLLLDPSKLYGPLESATPEYETFLELGQHIHTKLLARLNELLQQGKLIEFSENPQATFLAFFAENRRSLSFMENAFNKLMKNLGKICLDYLKSNKPLSEKLSTRFARFESNPLIHTLFLTALAEEIKLIQQPISRKKSCESREK